MKERIKKLRKALSLTQKEFAERIGTIQSTMAYWEQGKSQPSFAAFSNICKEFGVSDEWLRTGDGEMFKARSEDEELKEAIERLFSAQTPDFRRRLFKILARLDEEEWLALEKVAEKLAEEFPAAKERQDEKSAAFQQRETDDERIEREAELLKQEYIAEKRAELSASHVSTMKNLA